MNRRLLVLLWNACLPAFLAAASNGVLVININGSLTEKQSQGVVAQVSFPPKDVHTLLLVFDSEGGTLPESLAIADALSRAPISSCAYVKSAIGPTVFSVAACRRIVADASGVIGGGGLVPRAFFVLSDQLLTAAREELTIKLRDYAQKSGHDFEVFTAMIDTEQRLVRDGKVWKGIGEVLALTGREMFALRFADSTWRSVDEFVATLPDPKKRPNQPVQPTPGSVTPRATSSTSK